MSFSKEAISLAERAGRGREREIWPTPPDELGKRAAEEVAHAHAEGGQRKTRHVLIRAQGTMVRKL